MPSLHEITVTNDTSETVERTITDADAHVTVHAEKGSTATVSLVFDPEGESSIMLDVVVEQDAVLTVLCMQVAKSKKISITQTSKISDGGHLQLHNITLGSDVKQSVTSQLQGSKAVSDIDWIFYAKQSDKQHLSARNVFTGIDGGGEMNLKGVAEDQSHITCDGMIDIAETGTGTDTYLTEDVLMLDKTAKVDAVPGLEIKTNDVKASHSATVSKVTPEDLFYFASRGIDQAEARAMYVQGFLGDLTNKITDESLRDAVNTSIGAKFSDVN